MIDNFTYIRAAHSYKFGIDYQRIHDARVAAPQFLYTFPSIAAYQAAKAGANPLGYSSMTQITGDLDFAMDTSIYSTFVQDDWQIAPAVKVLYGVRYDLYRYPEGLANAPLAQTREFNIDKNNWGPRAGVAWAVSPTTAVRAQHRHHVRPADSRRLRAGAAAERIAEGARLHVQWHRRRRPGVSQPGGDRHAGRRSRRGPCHPDFQVARTKQANVQLEQAFGRDFTASVGFIYANGDNLPVVTDVNLGTPIRQLADGRPVYGASRWIRGSTASSKCSRSAIRRSRA